MQASARVKSGKCSRILATKKGRVMVGRSFSREYDSDDFVICIGMSLECTL